MLLTSFVFTPWQAFLSVIRAAVFEEEDFQPLVYGFRLCSEISEQKALAALKESEEELMKEIKALTPSDSDGTLPPELQASLSRPHQLKPANEKTPFFSLTRNSKLCIRGCDSSGTFTSCSSSSIDENRLQRER